jgi:enoyl-CoA hydratase/carnithine racemase
MGDVMRAGAALAADDAIRVIVLDSANPDFFIAHADVKLIQLLPAEAPPKPTELGFFHAMVDRFRTMPKATIGVLEGIARGGGSELLLSLDMRFGALGRAVLAQPEVALDHSRQRDAATAAPRKRRPRDHPRVRRFPPIWRSATAG